MLHVAEDKTQGIALALLRSTTTCTFFSSLQCTSLPLNKMEVSDSLAWGLITTPSDSCLGVSKSRSLGLLVS